MKVHIMELRSGDRLQTDIFNNYGVFVMQKGTRLTSDAIVRLMQHGVDYVDIEPQSLDADVPSEEGPSHPGQKVKPILDDAVDGFEQIFWKR
ncbi:hypothetical protein HMSSN036_47240 [Paenibacillus macerans]|nr:hypothetical protein HMSSN036_47240 [Paenibacillus macerans]